MQKSVKPVIETNDEIKSKSQVKRELHALQELGMEIAGLSKANRAKLPLSEELLSALALSDKIQNKHEANRRNANYIGRLMRDEDIDGINKVLNLIKNKHQEQDIKFRKYELLRDKLLEQGDEVIQDLLMTNEQIDRQQIRQIVRLAKKEVAQEKLGKNYKALFQFLRENITL